MESQGIPVEASINCGLHSWAFRVVFTDMKGLIVGRVIV
jgi:hypothetical protein